MTRNLRRIAEAGIVAALYVALTIMVEPIATGPIQFRVSEALMVLPALLPSSVVGLSLGVLLTNVLTGLGWIDIVFGTAATVLAAVFTRRIAQKMGIGFDADGKSFVQRRDLWRSKKIYLLPLPSVLFNTLIVGAYLPILYPSPDNPAIVYAILISMMQLAISEAVVVYLVGMPFYVGVYPFLIRRLEADAYHPAKCQG